MLIYIRSERGACPVALCHYHMCCVGLVQSACSSLLYLLISRVIEKSNTKCVFWTLHLCSVVVEDSRSKPVSNTVSRVPNQAFQQTLWMALVLRPSGLGRREERDVHSLLL